MMNKSNMILITGGAGTIGSLVTLKLSLNPNNVLVVYDRNENQLYFLKEKNTNLIARVEYVIGDILDKEKLKYIFKTYKIDTVIHTAAYKQVPMMENNVYELVKNNIEGLLNVINVSNMFEVKSFLFISSDKAVYPSSVMGLTKRVGEILIASMKMNYSKLNYTSLRISNLMNSNGSVLPLFEEQYRMFGKIYLTSNKVRRYFISNNQMVNYVVEALNYKGRYSLLIGDYKEEIYIKDLAKSFLIKKGCEKIEDYIEYVGLRQGEKISEELIYSYEESLHNENEELSEVEMNLEIESNFLSLVSNLVYNNHPSNECSTKLELKRIMKSFTYIR